MAVIEFARNKLKIKNATSSEFGSSKASVVGLMNEWIKDGKLIKGTNKNLGGTMRLGSYEARLKKDTLISNIYKAQKLMKDTDTGMKLTLILERNLKKRNDFFRTISRQ